MAPDYPSLTGLAENHMDEQLVTCCIFILFLTLFTIPLWVQLNILWQWIVFCKYIFILYGIFQCTFQVFFGTYCLVRECRKIQTTSQKISQWSLQALPPPNAFLIFSDLLEITLQQKHSLQITEDTVQKTLVLIHDHTSTEADPQKDYRPLSPTQIAEHIIDNSSQRDTPIHQVEPFLGTTMLENSQLQSATQPQDVCKILGTTAFEGYVWTLLQTLDGL